MQFLILFIMLGFCSLKAQVTQEWIKKYNGPGNAAYSLAVDGSGNVFVTGTRTVGGTILDYATLKYNSSGVQQWAQIFNGPATGDYGTSSLEVDDSGNVYVTGVSADTGESSDYVTIKYNSSGVQQWFQRYNGPGNNYDGAYSIAVAGSGNVYVTGNSDSGCATIKYNSSGVQQWVQRYNGPGPLYYASGHSLAVDDSENVYVAGRSEFDFATIKYNSSGVQQWIKRYGPIDVNGDKYSVALDGSGNVYVTGSFENGTGSDYATIKYNSSGIQQWVQRYSGPENSYNYPNSLAVDGSGNVYVTGTGYLSSSDFLTIKYNTSGVQQWVQTYRGVASSIAVDMSGNVYVTGSGGVYPNPDFVTIKYNSTGVQQWIQRYSGSTYVFDMAHSIAVDGSGNVYITGGSNGRYVTIKYSQSEVITAPSGLTAHSIDSSFIKVTWQDNSNDEEGFYIERTQINDTSQWEVIDEVPLNVNHYEDYFVTRNLKYYYRVNAYSGNIHSGYSNSDSAVLGGEPALIPAPPSKLTFLKRTPKAISMGWHDNSGNESGFIIFRRSESELFFKIIDSVNTDVVTYQEVGVSPNINYYYKVCSFNASGISDYSNTLFVSAKSSPVKTPELSGNSILFENYPNPFNPTTVICYSLIENRFTTLKVYDILGKEILTLVNEKQNAGTYSVEWDGSNYPSGIYYYRLQAGEVIETKKMMLLK